MFQLKNFLQGITKDWSLDISVYTREMQNIHNVLRQVDSLNRSSNAKAIKTEFSKASCFHHTLLSNITSYKQGILIFLSPIILLTDQMNTKKTTK